MASLFCTTSQGSKGLDCMHLGSTLNQLTTQRWEEILRDAGRWQGDPCVHNETHNWVVGISEKTIFVDDKSNTRIASLNVSAKPRDFVLSPSGKSILFQLEIDSLAGTDNYLWNINTQTVYQLGKSQWSIEWS